MYRRFFCCLAALVVFCFTAYADEERTYCGELIRLHVVAEGNFADEQALKLDVRDAVLAVAREKLGGCADSDAAWISLNENIGEFEDAARSVANGVDVRVETGVFEFPSRVYGGAEVPAGEYRALRIVLGEGEGRNWWCVIYPTLCTPETEDENVVYYSAVIEWFADIFGGW